MYLWEVASFPGWRAPSMWQILRVMVGWTESESTVCVRRRGCLTWVWRHLSRGSLCRSCVPSDRRCCSSPVPQWWRKLCRKLSAGHPSGFLCCCQTGYDTGSSAASEQLGPDQRDHILADRKAFKGDIKPESSSDKPKVILHKMAEQNTKINI